MKSRRVLAMILVLAFVFALMAVNVAAATPRAACPKCGSNEAYPSSTSFVDQYTEYVGGCQKHTMPHNHLHKKYESYMICRSCGRTSVMSSYWTTTCVL